jgi:hypothetical protein
MLEAAKPSGLVYLIGLALVAGLAILAVVEASNLLDGF